MQIKQENPSILMKRHDSHQLEIKIKYPKRDVRIEVSEDGENGCEIYYPKSDSVKTDYKTFEEMSQAEKRVN